MSRPLINAVRGPGNIAMIFYVDLETKEINQYHAPKGAETTEERENYAGPKAVKNLKKEKISTSSSDLAALSFVDDKKGLTVRIYYIGKDGLLKEICRETDSENSVLWRDGDLTRANLKADANTPISAYYDAENKQIRVYYFTPANKTPSVAFMKGADWVSRPIGKF